MRNIPDGRRAQNLLSQARRWREGEDALRELKGLLQRDQRDLRFVLAGIFDPAEDCKLGWQVYLLNRFGMDAETLTVLKGFRPPRTLEAAKELIVAGALHTFWTRVVEIRGELLRELAAAQVVAGSLPSFMRQPGRDPYAAAQKDVLAAFEELPATFGVIALSAHNQEIKEWAAERLASWTDTQISIEQHKRLKAALEEGELSPEQTKLLELVPASLIAFGEWEPGEPFRPGSGGKSYVSRVAESMVETGSEQAEKNEVGKEDEDGKSKPPRLEYADPERSEFGDEDPELKAAEEDLDREHNRRRLENIERQARLPKRQRQVYELDKAGYSGAEIAARLGIDGSTVRQHRMRALDAMQSAARKLGLLDAE